jgi:hypothetical protein
MNLNHSPCWFTAKKDNSDHAIKKYVRSDNVENKIVVVVWNHAGLPGLINDVTSFGVSWDDCCFDKVVVMDSKSKKLTSYDAKSLEQADLCGSPCKNDDSTISPYLTSQGQPCSYAIFGDSTPCTVPDSPTRPPTHPPTPTHPPVQPTGEDCEPQYNKDCPVNYWRCKYTDITSGCWPETQKSTAVTECRKHNNADICKKH